MNPSNLKKQLKFRVATTYTDSDNIYVKRATYYNTLYIYIYQRHIFSDKLLIALKVVVHE